MVRRAGGQKAAGRLEEVAVPLLRVAGAGLGLAAGRGRAGGRSAGRRADPSQWKERYASCHPPFAARPTLPVVKPQARAAAAVQPWQEQHLRPATHSRCRQPSECAPGSRLASAVSRPPADWRITLSCAFDLSWLCSCGRSASPDRAVICATRASRVPMPPAAAAQQAGALVASRLRCSSSEALERGGNGEAVASAARSGRGLERESERSGGTGATPPRLEPTMVMRPRQIDAPKTTAQTENRCGRTKCRAELIGVCRAGHELAAAISELRSKLAKPAGRLGETGREAGQAQARGACRDSETCTDIRNAQSTRWRAPKRAWSAMLFSCCAPCHWDSRAPERALGCTASPSLVARGPGSKCLCAPQPWCECWREGGAARLLAPARRCQLGMV